MVCHMDKSSLVDVLGSFASNAVTRTLHEKYQVMKYSNGMHIDMGIKILCEFQLLEILLENFLYIYWYQYWDAHVLRNYFLVKSSCLKFSQTENSWENTGSILLK